MQATSRPMTERHPIASGSPSLTAQRPGGTLDFRFHLLGPLEVTRGGREVPLRGIQQRAVLSYLLLRANTAVATSDLIKAVWEDDPPVTARKMLQNAVAGLRGVFAEAGPGTARVLTHAPGYRLEVRPENIDLWCFQQLAEAGRARLAAGDWQAAATTIREALGLRRGPVLADLAETGIAWPELQAAENAWLATVEDYAEAQLALGQHQDVVGQLEAVAAGTRELARERLSGLLMVALYRSSRQADALAVYRRTRTALIEQLGLDPSRELQELERAILGHDPMLAGPRAQDTVAVAPEPARPPERGTPHPALMSRAGVAARTPRPGPAETQAAGTLTERKPVTVILLRTGIGHQGADRDPEDLRADWQSHASSVERIVARHGGVVRQEAVGSLWVASFGLPRTHDDDAGRAIAAALDLRAQLSAGPTGPLIVQIAVASGEALVSCRPDAASDAEITGGVLDRSLRILAVTQPGEVRVCDVTRTASGDAFGFDRVDSGWSVTGRTYDGQPGPGNHLPLIERTREMRMLSVVLADVRRQGRAHLVTVLGEPGIGRSRLITEFRGVATEVDPGDPGLCPGRCFVIRARPFGGDTVETIVGGLASQISRLFAASAGCHDGVSIFTGGELEDVTLVSHQLIARLATQAPVVVIFEDLHWANDQLLDYVEDLVHHGSGLPLLVIGTARPELLSRRPFWGGEAGSASAITLEPLSDTGTGQLFRALWSGPPGPAGRSIDPECETELIGLAAGNPRFAVEYARYLRDPSGACRGAGADRHDLPPLVHRMIAARLDTLPALEKAVLQDAAVLGDIVCAVGVAAISGRDHDEVAAQMRLLESREFLRRADGRPVHETFGQIYAFRHGAVRQVAYGQMPRGLRADKHFRAAAWLRQQAGTSDEFYAHHYDNAVSLAQASGRTLRSTP